MNNQLLNLEPKKIWFYFNEILQIPRPSKKEEKIAAYLMNFAKAHNLEAKQDEIGNVYIAKPAAKGFENMQKVVLQSHLDMVCFISSFQFEYVCFLNIGPSVVYL